MPRLIEDETKEVTKERRMAPTPRLNENVEMESLTQAFGKPKDLWVVTTGRGWKNRPRHLVTRAFWNLPIKQWSTACGWNFACSSTEFYFVCGRQVDKEKCTKCVNYEKGAPEVGVA